MTISAQVLAHSVNPEGVALCTMQLRYPRYIHAEILTHRTFSRNASSSRAVPVAKLIEDVERDPVFPSHWGKNQPGMQAHEELDETEREEADVAWNSARAEMIMHARWLAKIGAHKQIVNRLLEPFAHINVVVSATEWENFFALRCHPDAQPEIRLLAEAMRDAKAMSTPRQIDYGEWHLPYMTQDDFLVSNRRVGMASAARCARVSYLTHEGKPTTIDADLALSEKLIASQHWSPFEHVACPDPVPGAWSANFRGWRSLRKVLENPDRAYSGAGNAMDFAQLQG